MSSLRDAIDAAKARLSLPWLLAQLDLERHARRSALCPLHDDRSPSFSVFQGTHGWRWKCHAGCGEGDEIDFLEAYFHISRTEAIRRFCAMAGQTLPAPPRSEDAVHREPSRWAAESSASVPLATEAGSPPGRLCYFPGSGLDPEHDDDHRDALRTGPGLPEDARPGTDADCYALAALRHLSPLAPYCATQVLGTLLFGTVCGFPCWIITDERRLCAEARRMDGEKFPAIGTLGERKAHTLKGSVKNWPVGLAVRRNPFGENPTWLAVEGGPDYLAALHFIMQTLPDCLPIAFLGAGAVRELHPEAVPRLRGHRVRCYPHHDANGAGLRAAYRWCRQLAALGCRTDAVDFRTLPHLDGRPIKDLNDCTRLGPEHAAELRGLIPGAELEEDPPPPPTQPDESPDESPDGAELEGRPV